ncbi:MAG: hypothetical protein HY721_29810 [Planctomycetes bacterium]|nr:hypothetical protein [Planctomycetota bacterium]
MTPMPEIDSVHEATTRFFLKILGKPCTVVAIQPHDGGFRVFAEIIEDDEHMRRYGRDGLVSVYEVLLDGDLRIQGYARRKARSRTAVPEPTPTKVDESIVLETSF